MRGAERDREIEIGAAEHADVAAGPRAQQLDDRARWSCAAFMTPPLNSTAVGIAAEPAEELGEVARDRRIVRVGQAELAQTAGAAALGRASASTVGEEAVDEHAPRPRSRVTSALIVPPISLLPRPRIEIGTALGRVVAEQLLLGAAARVDERALLHRIERLARVGELLPAIAASARSMLSPPSRM